MEHMFLTLFALVMYLGFATFALACLYAHLSIAKEDARINVALSRAFVPSERRPHIFAVIPPDYDAPFVTSPGATTVRVLRSVPCL